MAFPDLTPEEIPWSNLSGEQLAEDPALRERIVPLDLRYLIAVSGDEGYVEVRICGGLYPGSALLLAADRYSSLEATVIDLKQGRWAGVLNVSASGRPVVPVFPPFLPIPALTEARACGDVGEGVAKVLTGEKAPEGTEAEVPK